MHWITVGFVTVNRNTKSALVCTENSQSTCKQDHISAPSNTNSHQSVPGELRTGVSIVAHCLLLLMLANWTDPFRLFCLLSHETLSFSLILQTHLFSSDPAAETWPRSRPLAACHHILNNPAHLCIYAAQCVCVCVRESVSAPQQDETLFNLSGVKTSF